jgi:hypothetical protein
VPDLIGKPTLLRRSVRPSVTAVSIAVAITIFALTIAAATAHAAATRADYVAQSDPICRASNVQATKVLMRKDLRLDLDPSTLLSRDHDEALQFAAVIGATKRIYNRAIDRVAAIPPPPGDEGVIANWVADLRYYERAINRGIHAIRHGKDRQAYELLISTRRRLGADHKALAAWEFQYCA